MTSFIIIDCEGDLRLVLFIETTIPVLLNTKNCIHNDMLADLQIGEISITN